MLSLKGRQDDIMPYNGRFGIDIYAQDEHNANAWRWFGTSGGAAQRASSQEEFLSLRPLPENEPRKYTVYFPTHIPVSSLQIGVPESASLTSYEPHKGQQPIAIWASSIGQGGAPPRIANAALQSGCQILIFRPLRESGVVQNAGMTWISK